MEYFIFCLLTVNAKRVLQFYFVSVLFLFALEDFGLKKRILIILRSVIVTATAIVVT
jgi:hypothetical protein